MYIRHISESSILFTPFLSVYIDLLSPFTMAPSVDVDTPQPAHHFSDPLQRPVDIKVFPDGIRTSGQHPPIPDAIRPYSEFPKEITGQSVWKAEDYINNPERWVHVLTEDEVTELSATADKFLDEKLPLTGISKVFCHSNYCPTQEYFTDNNCRATSHYQIFPSS